MKIAIVGCGPAGLASALYLTRQGHSITMYEQFDEPTPVGSGLMLQMTGLSVLNDLGLANAIVERGKILDRIIGKTISGKTVLDVNLQSNRFGADTFSLGTHRAALFDVLYNAVMDAGIAICSKHRVIAVKENSGGVQLQCTITNTKQSYLTETYEFIVDASGANSALAKSHGLKRKELPFGALWSSLNWNSADGFSESALDQRYDKAHTMIGVMPIGRINIADNEKCAFFWSLPSNGYEIWKNSSLGEWKNKVEKLWPETASLLEQVTDHSQMTFARYGHHTMLKPYANRLIFIGDCAHSTSPQLGQGCNMALLDAKALAMAVDHSPEKVGQTYAKIRKWHIRLFQAISWWFTPLYQSSHPIPPVLRDYCLAPMLKAPGIPSLLSLLISGTLGNPLGKLGIQGIKAEDVIRLPKLD